MRQKQLNMASGIREFGHATPNRIAVIDGDRRLTFAELDERSSRFGSALLARGFRTGETVALLANNCAEYFEIAAGLAKAGIVMVPLNARNRSADNAYVLEHCEARALVLDAALVDGVDGLLDDLDLVVSFDGSVGESYETLLANGRAVDPSVEVSEMDTFGLTYTSGTTGRPKGVQLTHRGRVLTAFGVGLEYGLGPSTMTVAVAPMYHGAGFAFAYAGPFLGGTATVLRKWDPELLLRTIERDRAESVFLVPTHAQQIRKLTDEPSSTFDLSTLHTLYFNAAALPVVLKEWVIGAFPQAGIHELYGSTECGVVTNLRPELALARAGSVGHPWFMNEVLLKGSDGNEVAPGEPGELFARSPFLLSGYLKDRAATDEGFDDDGFFTVGDMATRDEEGFISIVDRVKDMIIAGGVNIYPREIEEAIARHSPIEEVAVIGLPDDEYGERVAAFFVEREPGAVDLDALRTHVESEVARYKVPREWHVVSQLPRNPSGKVLKREIRDGQSTDG